MDDYGRQQVSTAHHMKLQIKGRRHRVNFELDENEIDLINVGTYKGQLSFGLLNREKKKTAGELPPKVLTQNENPNKIVRNFIDQVLKHYFSIDI